MVPEATRLKSGYGWKLGTFRLPTDTYYFEVVSQKDAPDEMVELELKVTAPATYHNHRIRAFIPKEDKFYERTFHAVVEGDYGLIVPATVQKP
jgi:hypothetical protein